MNDVRLESPIYNVKFIITIISDRSTVRNDHKTNVHINSPVPTKIKVVIHKEYIITLAPKKSSSFAVEVPSFFMDFSAKHIGKTYLF